MPRTHLSRRSDTRRDLIADINQRRKDKHITLENLGRRYHVSGQRIGQKINSMALNYDELVDLMELLDMPPDRILWYMSGGRMSDVAQRLKEKCVI